MSWPRSKPDGLFGSMTWWVQGAGHNQPRYVFSSRPFPKQRISLHFYGEGFLHPHSRKKSSQSFIPSLTLRYISTTHGLGIWALLLYPIANRLLQNRYIDSWLENWVIYLYLHVVIFSVHVPMTLPQVSKWSTMHRVLIFKIPDLRSMNWRTFLWVEDYFGQLYLI